MGYRLSPRAKADIADITAYIAADNPAAAQRWFDRLRQRFETLAAMPEMGPARPAIGPSVRLLPFERYVILYRVEGREVDVMRIVHSSRDPEGWL